MLVSTMRLLDTLSRDDIIDGLRTDNIVRSGDNIENILFHEHVGKNIAIISCKKHVELPQTSQWDMEKARYYFYKACDNTFMKRVL